MPRTRHPAAVRIMLLNRKLRIHPAANSMIALRILLIVLTSIHTSAIGTGVCLQHNVLVSPMPCFRNRLAVRVLRASSSCLVLLVYPPEDHAST